MTQPPSYSDRLLESLREARSANPVSNCSERDYSVSAPPLPPDREAAMRAELDADIRANNERQAK